MAEEKVMLCNVKNAGLGSNQIVKRKHTQKENITEAIKYLRALYIIYLNHILLILYYS